MRAMLLVIIRLYQLILSPWTGNHCRFHPTCSEYAKAAIEKYGAIGGSWMAVKRILRCHPWHSGGVDPVP
jgi:putative membrane protein insertion efficiency factor